MAKPSRLPALHTLLYFEAAARHLNFTAAAAELGSTQPAVSLRVGQLESELGVPLFTRRHRGVSLTADGARLFEAVRQGLDLIGEVTGEILARRRQPLLTLATDFGFAAYWLMPRLPALREEMPELEVRIITSQQAIDLRDEVIDVAIAFGEGHWPGCVAEKLLPESVVPVCSPSFLAASGWRRETIPWAEVPLLHLERPTPARWMDWPDWFQLHRLPDHHPGHDLTFNNYPLVLQAAMSGQGVALGWLPLVQDLLAGGQLVSLVDAPITTPRGYFLVLRESTRLTGVIGRFRRWAREVCANGTQEQAGPGGTSA